MTPPVHPGDTCPTCERRVPHPKKADSPQSKVLAYRIPIGDADAHKENAAEAARELGIYDKPHWMWALHSYAYAMIFQGQRLEETGG